MKKLSLNVLVVIAAMAIVPTAMAQGFGHPGGGYGMGPGSGYGRGAMGKEAFFKRLKELREVILRDEVGLNEDKIKEVNAILDKYQEKDRAIFKEMRAAHLKLELLVVEDSEDNAKYKEIIDTIEGLHSERHSVKTQEFEELRRALTPKQHAKLMLSLKDARKKFMKAMGGPMGGHWGPPPFMEEPDDDDAPPLPPPARDGKKGKRNR